MEDGLVMEKSVWLEVCLQMDGKEMKKCEQKGKGLARELVLE